MHHRGKFLGIVITFNLTCICTIVSNKVEGELLTIQCSNAGSLDLARGVLQQFFSKPPAPIPKVSAVPHIMIKDGFLVSILLCFSGDAE